MGSTSPEIRSSGQSHLSTISSNVRQEQGDVVGHIFVVRVELLRVRGFRQHARLFLVAARVAWVQ
jgi:hypothetical protein